MFIGDDLILNPVINEQNYKSFLKITSTGCYLNDLTPFHKRKNFWERNPEAIHWRQQRVRCRV